MNTPVVLTQQKYLAHFSKSYSLFSQEKKNRVLKTPPRYKDGCLKSGASDALNMSQANAPLATENQGQNPLQGGLFLLG